MGLKIVFCALLLCTGIACAEDTELNQQLRPSLLVHGQGLSSTTWQALTSSMLEAGYPPEYVLAVDMLPADGDNMVAAQEHLLPGLQRLLLSAQERGCRTCKVDVVAHSMGAASARYLATYLAPEHIGKLITIAGANHGTNALCRFSGAGDKQMCPAFDTRVGSFQFLLNGGVTKDRDETSYGLGKDSPTRHTIAADDRRAIEYISVYLTKDEWIQPEASALLNGAGGSEIMFDPKYFRQHQTGNYEFLKSVAHDELPSHPEIIRFVMSLLLEP